MDITLYEQRTVGAYEALYEQYGVVSDDGERALRIGAFDMGQVTILDCGTGYRGYNLTFNGWKVSDPSDRYTPKDSQGDVFAPEICPLIADPDIRRDVVAMHAATLFRQEQSVA